MKAMKNYAGSRLSPWLGHLMVSRSETARPLLRIGAELSASLSLVRPAKDRAMSSRNGSLNVVAVLTPGEVMQLPPTDEIVMVSGVHPIRAKKARYYEDARLQERVLPPPVPTRPKEGRSDDWSSRPLPPRPPAPAMREGGEADDEDPKNADRRRQPELNQETVEKKEPIDNEFVLDPTDELEEDAPRVGRMNDLMQGLARQASLDPGDDLGL
jgi:type IV secretion system protein VirD4